MAHSICKCQQWLRPSSAQLLGKTMARDGPPWTSIRQDQGGLERYDTLGFVQLNLGLPRGWTHPCEQGLSLWLSEHQSLLLNPLEATSKVVETVGVFFPSPCESREVSLSVTLIDAICSLFGNTLFKSNLRQGGLREPLWLIFRTVI